MKIQIEIDEQEIRQIVMDQLASEAFKQIWEAHDIEDWDTRKEVAKKRRMEIVSQVDWKKGGPQIGEVVIRKFFEKLVEQV